jgi:hypothetical protein
MFDCQPQHNDAPTMLYVSVGQTTRVFPSLRTERVGTKISIPDLVEARPPWLVAFSFLIELNEEGRCRSAHSS